MGNSNNQGGGKEIDLGNVPVHTEKGTHHERIIIKTNDQGQVSDMLRSPISANPNGNHGHVWGLDTPKPGKRDPQQYGPYDKPRWGKNNNPKKK